MDISAFEAATGEPRRRIRYLVQEGILPPPDNGRRNADYGDRHLAAWTRYQTLSQRGYSLPQIRAMFEQERTAGPIGMMPADLPSPPGAPGLEFRAASTPPLVDAATAVVRIPVSPGIVLEIESGRDLGDPDPIIRDLRAALERRRRTFSLPMNTQERS